MSEDTSSDAPKDAHTGSKSDVRRTLPKVKTVKEGIQKSMLKSGDSEGSENDLQTPEQAKELLDQFNKRLKTRLDEVTKMTDVFPSEINPTQDPEFQKFIRDQLSFANMHYVVFGKFPTSVEDDRGSNPFINEDHQEVEMPAGTDPALMRHPAARDAVAHGLDLTGEEEDL